MVQSREKAKRLAAGILVTGLVALSLANWAERGRFGVPEDGVMWTDSEAGVAAVRVDPNSPGALVGVRPGDLLLSLGGQPVSEASDVPRILAGIGPWSRTEYRVERDGRSRALALVVAETPGRSAVGAFLLVLGWAYAGIGALVWLRRPASPTTSRFFAFCVASLAVYSLSFTGQLDALDRLVYWLDVWALLLMPPLFLDFCLSYPAGDARQRGLARLGYGLAVAVGAAHHAAAGGWVSGGIGEPAFLRFFDTAPLALLAANFGAAAVVGRRRVGQLGSPIQRLQWKWLFSGTVAAFVPFTALYVIPFAAGAAPGPNQAFSVLSLAALPVSIATALFRYKLLDLEIVWKRAAAAAVTAAVLLAAAYPALFGGAVPAQWMERYGPLVWLASLTLAAASCRPLYRRVTAALDRRTYRDRYEDRRTLAAFAAELATDTDLDRMVVAVAARLARTLDLSRVAVLVPEDCGDPGTCKARVLAGHGIPDELAGAGVDMSALVGQASKIRGPEEFPGGDPRLLPEPAERLGCGHFVECRLRERRLAWIGLGPTKAGGFLTSDDLSLVEALAAPFAIALENARLYASLRAKAAQYERLKDYNENIVESLSVGILVLDEKDLVQSWNTYLELALHVSRDSARGRKLSELLPASFVAEIERCAGETGSGSVHKYRLRGADFPERFRPGDPGDTTERVFNVAVAPLVDRQFREVGKLLILDDVTERIELEERVVQADKLSSVGLLAAGVAHEVNTPLAVISSYSQLLASRFSQGSTEARMLGKVTEQTFRASEIVNSLLDFSRTSSAETAPCEINRTITDTLDLIAPQLRQADVRVASDLCAPTTIQANKGKLQQVFLNLFLNARDAMPSGGGLRVTSRTVTAPSGEDYVEVLVADTGTGIPPEAQRQVFDPFFTTKDSRRGTGLGLAVTYGIVREHSGAISLESEPGKGTTFALQFPLANQPAHA